LDLHGSVAANLGVDLVFQRLELLGLDRLEMAEVKAQTLAIYQRAFLADMLTKNLPQSCMQQMGRRVVERRSLTHRGIHGRLNAAAHFQATAVENAVMQKSAAS